MPERDGAAVHVDDLLVGAEQPGRVRRDRGERLVDLDARDVARSSCRPWRARLPPPWPACARGRRTRRRHTPARRSSRAARSRGARPTPRWRRGRTRRRRSRPGALPAVVVPSGSNTGLSEASFSSEVSRRGLSSASSSPTATISSAKRPASIAATARWCERNAQASCSSREMPSSRETNDACSTMCLPSKVEMSASWSIRSIRRPVAEPVAEARLRERVRRVRHRLHPAGDDELGVAGADHRVGDLDRPDRGGAHLVDRVGTASRSGARRAIAACRAGAWPAPPWSTWPMITYSGSRGSIPARSSAARIAIAPSSAAGRDARPPPSLPNGVRTAPTMTLRAIVRA